jgi:hypothetical protein
MTWDDVKAGHYYVVSMKSMPNWEPRYRDAVERMHMRTQITRMYDNGEKSATQTPIAVLWDEEGRPNLVFEARP